MKKNLANIFTSLRLIGALILIFIPVRSLGFLILYAFCGLTDALDGWAARKFHSESEFGKKLDSVSDLTLYGIMLVKVWPLLEEALPKLGLYTIMGLILFRLLLYIFFFLWKHRFLSTHSLYNKAVSLLMFLLPFTLRLPYAGLYCYLIMVIGALSLIDEVSRFFI